MSYYSYEDYARDLAALDLSRIFEKLNVMRFELHRLTKLKEHSTLSELDQGCLEAIQSKIPIAESEVAKRGATIPHWIYPHSIF
jgi:hypothetical protein